MKTLHAPTPWTNENGFISDAMGNEVLQLSPTEIDSNRIVACVNACEGIADPSVIPELLKEVRQYLGAALDRLGREATSPGDHSRVDGLTALIARAEGRKS